MRYMVYVFFAYEFVNFMIPMGQASSGGRHTTTSAAMGEDSPVSGWCSIPLHQRFCTPLPRPWSQARVVPMGILPHPTRSTALGAVSLW